MRALNPRYLPNGWIDAHIEHPRLGWIPYTAAPNTGNEEAEAIWQELRFRDDVEPYVAGADLQERRENSWISRSKFCMGLKRAKILSPRDAVAAAKGEWPAVFSAALSALPTNVDQDDAQIVWASVSEVHRMNTVLLAVQAHLGLTDAEVDGLFGLSG